MQASLLKYMPSKVVRRSVRGSRAVADADGGSSRLASSIKRGSQAPSTTEDIINAILPPREWTEGGEVWAQSVSTTPATRGDVVALQEELDKRLKLRRAKSYGICPIREELYSQCFDELLRQVWPRQTSSWGKRPSQADTCSPRNRCIALKGMNV